MADELELDLTCHACGYLGPAAAESDGFFYCPNCGSQADDIIHTAVADEDLLADPRPRRRRPVIKVEPLSFSQQSQFWKTLQCAEDDGGVSVEVEEGVGPTGPSDFGSGYWRTVGGSDDYYREIRLRYVMGVQMMVQMQCKALVEVFGVSPLVCGLAGTVWLRFVAVSRIFDDTGADECIHESESQKQGMI